LVLICTSGIPQLRGRCMCSVAETVVKCSYTLYTNTVVSIVYIRKHVCRIS
jgi:hypothetical protein